MEFTPEQQAHIDRLIAENKQGLFTEEELTKRVTSEVDRRVESGIQKGLETQRAKWEQEFSEKAKLTAEELAQKELETKMLEISTREQMIKKQSNTLEAKDMLSSASIPKAHYEKFINFLVSDDDVVTKENVQNFINSFNETKSSIEADIKSQYSIVPPPSDGDSNKVTTKEDFDKMGYMERMAFKQSHPELFAQFLQ